MRAKKPKKRTLSLKDLTPADLRKLERLTKQWQRRLKPMKDAIERSEHITAKDLAIIVRAHG